MLLSSPDPAPADSGVHKAIPWCQLDDPAGFRTLRLAAAKEGRKDVECPAPVEANGGFPKELSLPMPCGRRMQFRRIDVPMEHVLDHVVGRFGRQVDPDKETSLTLLSSGAWEGPVAGGFSIAEDAASGTTQAVSRLKMRSYYMGKYEVTEPQALLWRMGLLEEGVASGSEGDPACADYLKALDGLPTRFVTAARGFSWYDGVAFSRAYTRWLVEGDKVRLATRTRPALPWEQGSTGVVRLPSESEWEYAARGGIGGATGEARSVPLPRIIDTKTGQERSPAQISEICVKVREVSDAPRVGTRAPNVVMLYDTICGVEEIVLDLFRAVRPGEQLHGQVGGFTTRGGASGFRAERHTVGTRFEKPLFGLKGETNVSTIGLRFAIGAPVFVGRRDSVNVYEENRANAPLDEALQKGRRTLLAQHGAAKSQRRNFEAEMKQLRQELDEKQLDRDALQNRLAVLQNRVDRLNVELGQVARDNVRQSIRAGVVSANLIDRVGRNLYFAMHQRRVVERKGAKTDMTVERWRSDVATNNGRIDTAFELYLQLQRELTGESEDFVSRQIDNARGELAGTSLTVFGTYLDMFARHHSELRRGRGAVTEGMRSRWIYELDTQRKLREEKFPEFL